MCQEIARLILYFTGNNYANKKKTSAITTKSEDNTLREATLGDLHHYTKCKFCII